MAPVRREPKCARRDLHTTFEILVGDQRFTVHESYFIPRSRLLAGVRNPESENYAPGPVDLRNQDPDLFHTYINCVYSGDGVLYERLADFDHALEPFATRLYLSHIPADANRESLTHLLERFGELQKLNIYESHGYVDFVEADSCVKASSALKSDETGMTAEFAFDVAMMKAGRTGSKLAQDLYMELVRSHILAARLGDARTMNQVMEALLDCFRRRQILPRHACIQRAYSRTEDSSTIRVFLRDAWLSQGADVCKDLRQDNRYPKEFVDEVLSEVMSTEYQASKHRDLEGQGLKVFRKNRCDRYHKHNVFYSPEGDCQYQTQGEWEERNGLQLKQTFQVTME